MAFLAGHAVPAIASAVERGMPAVRKSLHLPSLASRNVRAAATAALLAEKGLRVAKAFEFGEALAEGGATGLSGLHALCWAPTYLAHAVGVIGLLPYEQQTLAYPLIQFAARSSTKGYEAPDAVKFDHPILRRAWIRWTESFEDDSAMPMEIREYLAIVRGSKEPIKAPPDVSPVLYDVSLPPLRLAAIGRVKEWLERRIEA
jgi:hypothetical protein